MKELDKSGKKEGHAKTEKPERNPYAGASKAKQKFSSGTWGEKM